MTISAFQGLASSLNHIKQEDFPASYDRMISELPNFPNKIQYLESLLSEFREQDQSSRYQIQNLQYELERTHYNLEDLGLRVAQSGYESGLD